MERKYSKRDDVSSTKIVYKATKKERRAGIKEMISTMIKNIDEKQSKDNK